jgi:hypothetical protein
MPLNGCHTRGIPRRTSPSPRALRAGLIAALALLSCPAQAETKEVSTQCLDAYASGQRDRRLGEFGRARAAFRFCGGRTCPAALHADCSLWLDELEAATPTAVFQIKSVSGEDLHGASVRVDGGSPEVLDGRALAVDPGEHVVLFEAPGYQPLEQRITFNEGEKLMMRFASLEALPVGTPQERPAAAPAPDTAAAGPTLVPTWIGLGVGVLGGAGFVYFGMKARAADRDLGSCAPNCSVARTSAVERDYLLANVSLGVGVAGALFAVGWALFAPDTEPPRAVSVAGFELRVDHMLTIERKF